MLTIVKKALRITANAYDDELSLLISAALSDLGIAGVEQALNDDQYRLAVITYCRVHFGSPNDYDRLKAAYDEMKAQMQMSTRYNGTEAGE